MFVDRLERNINKHHGNHFNVFLLHFFLFWSCNKIIFFNSILLLQEDEEPLPEDELPEYLKKKPQINFDPSNIPENPENLLKMSKKHQTLMMFVSVKDHMSKLQADEMTKIWQSALWNNHMQAER